MLTSPPKKFRQRGVLVGVPTKTGPCNLLQRVRPAGTVVQGQVTGKTR